MPVRSVPVLAAVLVSLLAWSVVAAAHHLAYPKADMVAVSSKEIRIAIDYAIEPAKAGDVRARFSGKPAELETYIRALATHFLEVSVDGNKLDLKEIAVEMRGIDRTEGDVGGLFVLSSPLKLAKGPHRLELADRHKDGLVEVPVTITFARGFESDAPDTPTLLGPQRRSLAVEFTAP